MWIQYLPYCGAKSPSSLHAHTHARIYMWKYFFFVFILIHMFTYTYYVLTNVMITFVYVKLSLPKVILFVPTQLSIFINRLSKVLSQFPFIRPFFLYIAELNMHAIFAAERLTTNNQCMIYSPLYKNQHRKFVY